MAPFFFSQASFQTSRRLSDFTPGRQTTTAPQQLNPSAPRTSENLVAHFWQAAAAKALLTVAFQSPSLEYEGI